MLSIAHPKPWKGSIEQPVSPTGVLGPKTLISQRVVTRQIGFRIWGINFALNIRREHAQISQYLHALHKQTQVQLHVCFKVRLLGLKILLSRLQLLRRGC